MSAARTTAITCPFSERSLSAAAFTSAACTSGGRRTTSFTASVFSRGMRKKLRAPIVVAQRCHYISGTPSVGARLHQPEAP
jgi:hypothetical protein